MDENRYLGFTIEQLQHRLKLSGFVLMLVNKCRDDPRHEAAHEHYLGEQKQINQALVMKLAERRADLGEPEPESIIAGLNSLHLSGKLKSRS